MDRVVLLIVALLAGGAGMSFLLSRLFSRKWVWYIPSMIGLFIVAYLTFKIETVNMEGFEELGYIIQTLMVIVFMAGNILMNIFMTLRRKKKADKGDKYDDK